MKYSAKSAGLIFFMPPKLDVVVSKTLIYKIMRFSLFTALILLSSLQLMLASSTKGQGIEQVTLKASFEKITPLEALKKIETQTSFRFLYRPEQLVGLKSFDLPEGTYTISEILNKLIEGSRFRIRQLNDVNVAILPIEQVQVAIAEIRISGQVKDKSGLPLPGVTVMLKNTRKSTATDRNGHFGIEVPDASTAVLVFSYVGYQTQEISIAGRSAITVTLVEEAGSLDEIQVIGYGTTTKRTSTGSVASITSKDIQNQPVGNPLAALSGRMSGVLIAQNNGVPGGAVQVQIRNQGALNPTSTGSIPLYVIDGVPFTNFNGGFPPTDNLNANGTSGSSGGLSPFSMINPADIERIDVLKDADATAIYGSRGANGVVLITTKKGQSGRTRIGVNFNTGFTEVGRFIPMLDLQQYLALRKEAFQNDGATPSNANAPDLTLWDQNASTDWQKLLIGNTGHITDLQANLSGGGEQTRFFFNAGYRRESAVFYGDNRNARFASRLNLDHRSADNKFNAAFTVSYANDDTNLPLTDVTSFYNLPPNFPLYDPQGRFYWFAGSSSIDNPLALLNRKYIGTTNNLISNVNLSYQIIPGLTAKSNFGYTITQLEQNARTPASTQNPASNPLSSARFANTKSQNWIIEPTLEYAKNLGKGKFLALVGTSFQQNSSATTNINATNFSNESLLGSLSAAGNNTLTNVLVKYKYTAVFGRLNYDWKEKYLANATFRRDGSSRFGPQNRFGNFGALGLGWVFSKERFVSENMSFLSFGKLRGSFGVTGNDQIANYIYLPLYSSSNPYLGNATMQLVTLQNQSIQWETTRKLEFAIDLGFLNDRILFTGNYFRNRSSDQITNDGLASQAGYNSYVANLPALVQNKGLELELNTTNINTEGFSWRTALNFTFYSNKLLEFPNLERTLNANNYVVGEPINVLRLYRYTGVNPTTGAATYQDADGNGLINENDRYIADIGTPFYGGFNNTFSYKGFELGVFFQFNHRFGVTKILNTRPGALFNQNDYWLGRWSPSNPSSEIPGATATSGSPIYTSYNQYATNNTPSDAVYGDASYIKLRSVNLSYNLPSNWLSKVKMSNCSVFVQGQNLFTWAKNKYVLDTETTVQGGPQGLGTGTVGQVLPPLRTIVFGINCQF
jgi:TonB-linked SusC/RagA family outer membrane protein